MLTLLYGQINQSLSKGKDRLIAPLYFDNIACLNFSGFTWCFHEWPPPHTSSHEVYYLLRCRIEGIFSAYLYFLFTSFLCCILISSDNGGDGYIWKITSSLDCHSVYSTPCRSAFVFVKILTFPSGLWGWNPSRSSDLLDLSCWSALNKPGHFHRVRSLNRTNPSGQRN